MKNFHWAKLRGNQVDTSLFKDLKPGAIKFDSSALEKLFCVKSNEKEGEDGKKKKLQAPPKVSHINPKLLQSVGIFLKQVQNSKDVKAVLEKSPLPFNRVIKEAILTHSSLLDVDRIQGFIQGNIEDSELQTIKEWANNKENNLEQLNEVDAFFLEISEIPQYIQRLKCWRFTLKFEEDNSAIVVELLKIKKGLRCISSAEHFKKVLEVVLAVGNFMNHGGRAGNTVGFDISILPKLVETRANDPMAGTLMDFVTTTIETGYPESMQWTKELTELKYAKEASWEKIDTLIKELKANLTVVKGLAAAIPLLPSPAVDLFPKIKDAVSKAEEEFDETRILFDAVVDDWGSLAKLYAKDPTKVKPEQFFDDIHGFVAKFESSIVDREKRIAEAKKRELKQKALEEVERRKRELQEKKKKALEPTKEEEEQIEGMLTSFVSVKKPRPGPAAPANVQVAAPPENEESSAAAGDGGGKSQAEIDREARRAAIQAKQRARKLAQEASKPQPIQEQPEPTPPEPEENAAASTEAASVGKTQAEIDREARRAAIQAKQRARKLAAEPPAQTPEPSPRVDAPAPVEVPQTVVTPEPEPTPAAAPPSVEDSKEAERAARRAAIQAKHRARKAALESKANDD
jgi:hypothetical protein